MVLLCACLILNPLPAWSLTGDDLPDFGAASGNMLSPLAEQRLGKAFMRWVRGNQDVLDDPLLEEYLKNLGESLVKNSDGLGTQFHFFFVDSPDINAFAGPAAYLGINTGLMLITDTESELAAVVAHEITHVTQKHLMRAWHSANSMSIVQTAALIGAVILGATVGGDAAIAASMGSQAMLKQNQINFTRSNEQEADRIGIGILQQSGFESHAMPGFFSRMARANRSYGAQLPEYLRTHPVTNSRIADSQGRADQYPYRQHTDSFPYLLTKAALIERNYSDPAEAVKYFGSSLRDGRYRNESANRYGYARAFLRDHQLTKAQQQVSQLLAAHPDSLEFLVLQSQIQVEQGKMSQAIATLEKNNSKFSLNYPYHIILSETYLRAGKAGQAYQLLQKLDRLRPDNTRVQALQAQAAADVGEKAQSHEHLAEYYQLMGAPKTALLQLKIALRTPGLNNYDEARLEYKLQQMQMEVDELEKEK
jgi:predicted Zn-dependent protease